MNYNAIALDTLEVPKNLKWLVCTDRTVQETSPSSEKVLWDSTALEYSTLREFPCSHKNKPERI